MSNTNKKIVSVGGQALIEGIMMQGPEGAALSVRCPDGTIDTEILEVKHIKDKFKPLGWPMIRGIVNYVESMIFGYKLLMESAEKTALDTEHEENESKLDKWINDHFGPKMMAVIGGISAVLGVALAFFLFMWLPSFVFDLVNNHLANGTLLSWRAVFEGAIRVVIFVVYMYAVSKMKEIHRVYMYHGAEHKTIFAFEHGKELTVENIRSEKRCHPRCGTSFIFVIIIISVVISSAVSVIAPQLRDERIIWMAVKLLILPFVTGISYEFIKYAGKHDNLFVRICAAPGLWMQRLTTKEPDENMIEVAISAFNASMTGVVPEKEPKEEIGGHSAVSPYPFSVETSQVQFQQLLFLNQ